MTSYRMGDLPRQKEIEGILSSGTVEERLDKLTRWTASIGMMAYASRSDHNVYPNPPGLSEVCNAAVVDAKRITSSEEEQK